MRNTPAQRIAIAVISVPATVVLAVALFTFNALVPETYAALLRFADWVWQETLNALSTSGDTIPGARKLSNVARQGFSGHHFVIMALCGMVAAFFVNGLSPWEEAPDKGQLGDDGNLVVVYPIPQSLATFYGSRGAVFMPSPQYLFGQEPVPASEFPEPKP